MPAPGASLRRSRRAAVLVVLVAAVVPPLSGQSASRGRNARQHLDAPYVVLVSIDGFRHDYPERFPTPNLDRLIRAGVRADALVPAFPVRTFPNHYTVATGLHPARHGIVANRFMDPATGARYAIDDRESVEEASWYGGEPIWVTAELQGMITAAFFWVGTEASVGGTSPTHWHRFDGDVSSRTRVDRVLRWLAEPAPVRPHLVTLYFEDVDEAGHEGPTESPALAAAVDAVDGALGRLLDGVAALPHGERVHVVVTSDHGMAPYASDRVYYLPDLIELPETVVTAGSSSSVILYVDGTEQETRDLQQRLREVTPHARVYRSGEAPERLRWEGSSRLGDLLIVPEPGWLVATWPESEFRLGNGWTHGWDPIHPDMHGVFIAAGPGLRSGLRLPALDNVHVYPLLARLLGLHPARMIDGRLDVLEPALRDGW